MSRVEQPAFGLMLKQLRMQAGPGGRKMSRLDFAARIGITATQVRNIEQGRKLKPGEYELIVAAFPQIETMSSTVDITPPTAPTAQESTQMEETPSQTVYGELVALDPELEDPELQATATQRIVSPGEAKHLPLVRRFSNSEIQTFKRCRRKWYLGWYQRLRLRNQDPVGALAIGNRVHRALEAWYVPEGDNPTDPRTALEAAIASDWEACKQAYAEIGQEPPPELVKEFNENTALERAMVEGYMEWLIETGVDSGLRVVAPETYLEAPLEVPGSNVDVLLIGKLDVRMIREYDGVRLFMDHKTTLSLTEPLKTIRLDEQMLHYHVLEWLSDVEGGRCDGALYNMLRKVKRSARAKPPFYDRVEVRHNKHELESFRRRLVGVIKTMLDVIARLEADEDPHVVVYPSPARDCSWSCDFLPVCTMFDDGSRVDAMLEQYYVQEDPLSHYKRNEE